MINRDLIRRKIVQLTYAYYQNSNHNIDNAEKELLFALSKSYDLYNYMLQLIVALTQEAQKRYEVEVARAQREGASDVCSSDLLQSLLQDSHTIDLLCSWKRTRCSPIGLM